jgi:hypothetical protein
LRRSFEVKDPNLASNPAKSNGSGGPALPESLLTPQSTWIAAAAAASVVVAAPVLPPAAAAA